MEKVEEDMIQNAIAGLVQYALATGLIRQEDAIWAANRILAVMKMDELSEEAEQAICSFDPADQSVVPLLPEILSTLCDAAVESGLIEEDTVTRRDLFDTELMGALCDRPSCISQKFRQIYREEGAKAATDWYYKFSCDTNYIRRDRIAKDVRWLAPTPYGDMDITINLSKPEKDPRAIAAAKFAKQTAYPKCQLCYENVGYAGRLNHPARANHRVIPITIDDQPWCLQYSPYVYYNEHCIVFNSRHIPMVIDKSAFRKLFDFVSQFPHYFVGSNADLPIVGGSILAHEHFQGGHYEFAMAKAKVEKPLSFAGFEDVDAGIVKWPMSVIRLSHEDPSRIVDLADRILTCWRAYTDEDAFIFAETDGEKHNTITPIARKRGGKFELDLVLRNNITTKEHPLGLYHPHAALHHIKKENIGLIEVMGCAILPARLREEMAMLKEAVLSGKDYRKNETLEKHADWMDDIRSRHTDLNAENIDQVLRDEIGAVFSRVLEDAGVYKRDAKGQKAFLRFVESVNKG
jgi:UDPglucose--hexose-1-phosphate uridylyltransferase